VRSTNALVVPMTLSLLPNGSRLQSWLRYRLPSASGLRELAEAGGLMAHGVSFGALHRRAASHVSKILQVPRLPIFRSNSQ
jgi:hypothetical protein